MSQLASFARRLVTLMLAAITSIAMYSAAASADPPPTILSHAPDLPDVARGVPMGGAIEVFGLDLEDYGTTDLQLERFQVFSPDVEIEVVDGPVATVPSTAYFRGSLADDPDSTVLFMVREDGTVDALVRSGASTWAIQRAAQGRPDFVSEKLDLDAEFADRSPEDCLYYAENGYWPEDAPVDEVAGTQPMEGGDPDFPLH